MDRLHPNLSTAATCALIVLALGLGGCRSSSSGVAGSPFMSPDRVPPPNTRALAPGQAQPYYQGDPLPAMQSGAEQPAGGVATLPREAETHSANARTLTWSQPSSANPAPVATVAAIAPAAVPPPQPQPALLQPPQPVPVVAATEAAVSVPNDGDPLRFPLPAPAPPESAAPIASAVPLAVETQPVQPVVMQPQQGIVQASYTGTMPATLAQPVAAPVVASPQQTTSPWRSPQIVQSEAQVGLPSPPMIPSNTVAATLQAVPPQPGDPMPRVRVPGYMGTTVAGDGFRPRTSMQ